MKWLYDRIVPPSAVECIGRTLTWNPLKWLIRDIYRPVLEEALKRDIKFLGVPVVTDPDVPTDTIYFINQDTMYHGD